MERSEFMQSAVSRYDHYVIALRSTGWEILLRSDARIFLCDQMTNRRHMVGSNAANIASVGQSLNKRTMRYFCRMSSWFGITCRKCCSSEGYGECLTTGKCIAEGSPWVLREWSGGGGDIRWIASTHGLICLQSNEASVVWVTYKYCSHVGCLCIYHLCVIRVCSGLHFHL